MATSSYGRQFELMMTEISSDLVKGLFKERGIEFEESDMDFIRNFFNAPSAAVVSVSVEKVVVPVPKKSKGGKGGKGINRGRGVVVESPDLDPELEPAVIIKPKGKGKAGAKPKCQATTAKGTPCSKCASDGEIFCSVHLTAAATSTKKNKAKKDSGEGSSSSSATKKGSITPKKMVPKHTHGLTSPVPDTGCDLCETHGMPFEIPEYEEERDDPTYTLEEEDFDEID